MLYHGKIPHKDFFFLKKTKSVSQTKQMGNEWFAERKWYDSLMSSKCVYHSVHSFCFFFFQLDFLFANHILLSWKQYKEILSKIFVSFSYLFFCRKNMSSWWVLPKSQWKWHKNDSKRWLLSTVKHFTCPFHSTISFKMRVNKRIAIAPHILIS